jgi:hypothetical protein
MSELTKEELLALLRKKEEEEPSNSDNCIYKPIRGNQIRCHSKATTPYGFCTKHSNTVQARKIKAKWEAEQQEPPKPVEEPVIEEPPKPVEEVPVEEPQTPVEEPDIEEEPEEEIVLKKPSPKPVRKQKPVRKPVKRVITKNEFGRYEDPVTHIVFDPRASGRPYAFGVQAKNGALMGLGPEHIKICKKNKWEYVDIPEDDEESDSDTSEEFEEVESESEIEDESGSEEVDSESDYYVDSEAESEEPEPEEEDESEEEPEEYTDDSYNSSDFEDY